MALLKHTGLFSAPYRTFQTMKGTGLCLNNTVQAPVVQKLDSAIPRINHYPVDNAIGFPITYPLDRDLSGG